MSNDTGKNLRLPATLPLGAGVETTNRVIDKWNTVDAVQEELFLRGLGDKNQPTFGCPELTSEMLTTNDSKHYTDTYAHLLAWFTYTTEIYAVVQSTVLQYKNMQDILGAENRKTQRELASGAKKPSKEELEDRLLLNPEYQEVTLKLQRFQQAKLLYEAKVQSIERSLRVISRQIEIRRLDIEQNRTQGGIGNRGPMGHNRWGDPER